MSLWPWVSRSELEAVVKEMRAQNMELRGQIIDLAESNVKVAKQVEEMVAREIDRGWQRLREMAK